MVLLEYAFAIYIVRSRARAYMRARMYTHMCMHIRLRVLYKVAVRMMFAKYTVCFRHNDCNRKQVRLQICTLLCGCKRCFVGRLVLIARGLDSACALIEITFAERRYKSCASWFWGECVFLCARAIFWGMGQAAKMNISSNFWVKHILFGWVRRFLTKRGKKCLNRRFFTTECLICRYPKKI